MSSPEEHTAAIIIQRFFRKQRLTQAFWQSTHQYKIKKPQYFVLKKHWLDVQQPAKDAVKENLAYRLYQLLGVQTPTVYLTTVDNKPALLSEMVSGYRDLSHWLGGDQAIHNLVSSESSLNKDELIHTFQDLCGKNQLNIVGKENLLVAAVFLNDVDVIGAAMTNLGLIRNKNTHQIIKIDPGDANLISQKGAFVSSLNEEYELLLDTFSFPPVANNPKILGGNRHLLEFFDGISSEKVTLALDKLNKLSSSMLSEIIQSPVYVDFLVKHNEREIVYETKVEQAQSFLVSIFNSLLERKKLLGNLVVNPSEPELAMVIEQPQLVDINEFSLPLHKIPTGNSKPQVVRRKFADESTDPILSRDLINFHPSSSTRSCVKQRPSLL